MSQRSRDSQQIERMLLKSTNVNKQVAQELLRTKR